MKESFRNQPPSVKWRSARQALISGVVFVFYGAITLGADSSKSPALPWEQLPFVLEVDWRWAPETVPAPAAFKTYQHEFFSLCERTISPSLQIQKAKESASDCDLQVEVLLRKTAEGVRYQISAQYSSIPLLLPEQKGLIAEPRDVPLHILQAIQRYQPGLAKVAKIQDETALLFLKGGERFPTDPQTSTVGKGTILQPWMIVRNAEGNITGQQPISWTYLEVTTRDGADLQCQIHSGLRQALSARQRGRVEILAVPVDSQWWPQGTLLTVRQLSQPVKPWSVCRIQQHSTAAPSEKDSETEPLSLRRTGWTDRDGMLLIPANPATPRSSPILWITASSGDQTMARVPICPGASPRLTLDLPDDTIRRQVEQDLHQIEQDLVVTVASHTSLMAATRLAAKANRWDDVERLLAELRRQPVAEDYRKRVNAVRVRGLNLAKAREDRLAAARIERLCQQSTQTIDRFLAGQTLKQLQEEMAELKAAVRSAPPEPLPEVQIKERR